MPKKIIVGCIYHHPKMPIPYFNNYFLNTILEKIGTENKEVMLLRDFNIDLLKVEQENNNNNFLDILRVFHVSSTNNSTYKSV